MSKEYILMFLVAAELDVPIAGSVLGIITSILSSIMVIGIIALSRALMFMARDIRELKEDVHGDPDRGEVPLRIEINEIRKQTTINSQKLATKEAIQEDKEAP